MLMKVERPRAAVDSAKAKATDVFSTQYVLSSKPNLKQKTQKM